MSEKALIKSMTASSSLDLAPQTWTMMKEQATLLVKSGLIPASIRTPEAAIAIMLKGRELGIPPMQAFAQISIINGKPAVGAELMLGLIFRRYPHAPVHIKENSAERAVVEAGRSGSRKLTEFKFDQADAKRAQLLNKSTWQQYPQMMLFWRCVSMMARQLYPECLMGASHTPEELGAEVNEDGEVIDEVNEDGEVNEVQDRPTPAAQTQAAQELVRGVFDPPAAPPVEYFDSMDPVHVRRLEAQLEARKAPQAITHFVKSYMAGLEMNLATLDRAIFAAKRDLASRDTVRVPEPIDEPGDPQA